MALASLVKVKTNVPAAFFLIKKGFTSAFCGTVNATFETKCWIQDFKVTFNSSRLLFLLLIIRMGRNETGFTVD